MCSPAHFLRSMHNHRMSRVGRVGGGGKRAWSDLDFRDGIIDDCAEAFDGFRFDCECELIWLASENGD